LILARVLVVLVFISSPLFLGLTSCESEREVVDTTRPAAVTDLSLDSVKTSALYFSWTATGDDGIEGKARFYDLRYSLDSATMQMWGGATPLPGEPVPSDPGTHEDMMLNLTLANSKYYFGLKVSDESNNTSRLSNVVTHQP
jgi:hypothetical protein